MRVMHKLPVAPSVAPDVVLIFGNTLDFSKNQKRDPCRPALARGALRDRHERWARDAMDVLGRSALAAPTNDLNADGEVVWS